MVSRFESGALTLADDGDQMDDYFYSLGRFFKGYGIGNIPVVDIGSGAGKDPFAAGVVDQAPNAMVPRLQFADHPASQEAGSPGHQNQHHKPRAHLTPATAGNPNPTCRRKRSLAA